MKENVDVKFDYIKERVCTTFFHLLPVGSKNLTLAQAVRHKTGRSHTPKIQETLDAKIELARTTVGLDKPV